ncbi:UNVERIFIED_CONTAM: hypothetical protein RMT77_019040 [Armadillidium vulgare]
MQKGIGKEAAFDLANRGARVILACRNLEKAEKVKEWIVSSTGNKNVICRHLELSDLDSVRKFAEETLEREKRLDVLVNNAGVLHSRKLFSKQNFELTLAVNHYGHFLLTNLLLDLIIKSKPSRIINVSSSALWHGKVDVKDLHFRERNYSRREAYFQSKLCNFLFTTELAHRLRMRGVTSVTVNCLHPGVVDTEIFQKSGSKLLVFLKYFLQSGFKDPKLGAQTIIHLAVSDKVKNITGEYFVDCKIVDTSKLSKDRNIAKELWEVSEKDVGLSLLKNALSGLGEYLRKVF